MPARLHVFPFVESTSHSPINDFAYGVSICTAGLYSVRALAFPLPLGDDLIPDDPELSIWIIV